ncbi:MAG TPA: HIT domain-containing protein [Bryobacteraceae bacterium]|nr:HIT domain-containing protein [Bryobacteraceae bacterium]
MQHLWTPWRSTYMKAAKDSSRECVFCAAAEQENDVESLIAYRAGHSFIILNRYPYTSGHIMIAPYAHVSRLNDAPAETIAEIAELTRTAEIVLERAYKPDGINLGMNLGRAAGAGIAEHIHMHMLPRWNGDANFMTSVADTRIIPESLDETYEKIRQGFEQLRVGT